MDFQNENPAESVESTSHWSTKTMDREREREREIGIIEKTLGTNVYKVGGPHFLNLAIE